MKVKFLAIATLFTAIFVGGCSVVNYVSESKSIMQVTTNQATMRVIERADNEESRADRILALVSDIESSVRDEDEVSLDFLFDRVEERIDWDELSHASESLIKAVLLEAETRLEERIEESDALSSEDRVKIKTFLSWIKNAAESYT